MKSKLLPVALVLLILLNGFLIFMLIQKPHENSHGPKRNFLIEELKFSEQQKESFKELDDIHKGLMQSFDKKIDRDRDFLFNSFAKENFNADVITKEIGFLSASKEAELFRFFSEVRKICSQEQVNKFDSIINKALKGGKRNPPRDYRPPPSR
jgi:protein CpxP